MLLISRISNLQMHSPEWKAARIGRLFTSSSRYKLMGKEGIGDLGMTYIRGKVFETLSGLSVDKEIDTDAVKWGLAYENFNLQKAGAKLGLEFVVTQKMVEIDKNEATTPDALILRKKHTDGLHWDVSTLEAKCYQHEKHMKCAECDTPQEIKKVDPSAYWQKIHQIDAVDCLDGYLSYYHPDLPVDDWGLKIIHFRKMQKAVENKKELYPIVNDLSFMKKRKLEALAIFTNLLNRNKATIS